MRECQWFLNCEEESMGEVEHPTIGWVPICAAHFEWLTSDSEEGVNPTKLVPPLAAKHGQKLRETLARLEEGD